MLKIANAYGNVDVRRKLSGAYAHIKGQRLQPLCRKLGIQYAEAMTGFVKNGKYGYKAEINGVVVSFRSAPKLLEKISEREKRATKKTADQLIADRKRRQQRDEQVFADEILRQYPSCSCPQSIAAHACDIGSGRVGRTKTIPLEERVHAAVVASVRHNYTDYESRLRDYADLGKGDASMQRDYRELARDEVAATITEMLKAWETVQPPLQ
jgi:hypothetical protein